MTTTGRRVASVWNSIRSTESGCSEKSRDMTEGCIKKYFENTFFQSNVRSPAWNFERSVRANNKAHPQSVIFLSVNSQNKMRWIQSPEQIGRVVESSFRNMSKFLTKEFWQDAKSREKHKLSWSKWIKFNLQRDAAFLAGSLVCQLLHFADSLGLNLVERFIRRQSNTVHAFRIGHP